MSRTYRISLPAYLEMTMIPLGMNSLDILMAWERNPPEFSRTSMRSPLSLPSFFKDWMAVFTSCSALIPSPLS